MSENSDFRIKTGAFDHLKLRRVLARFGGAGLAGWVRMIEYTAAHASTGVIGKVSDREAAVLFKLPELDLPHRGEDLVTFFLDEEVVLAERDGAGRLLVHNWKKHNSWAAKARERAEEGLFNANRRWHGEEYAQAERAKEHGHPDGTPSPLVVGTHVGSQSVPSGDPNAPSLPSPSLPFPKKKRATKRRATRKAASPRAKKANGADKPQSPAGMSLAVDLWFVAYQEANEESKPTWGPAQGAQLKRLLKIHGFEEFHDRLQNFKAHHEAQSFAADAWDFLGNFVKHFDRWGSPPKTNQPRGYGRQTHAGAFGDMFSDLAAEDSRHVELDDYSQGFVALGAGEEDDGGQDVGSEAPRQADRGIRTTHKGSVPGSGPEEALDQEPGREAPRRRPRRLVGRGDRGGGGSDPDGT